MINDKIDPFIKSYREAMQRQRDLAFQDLKNHRRNYQTSLMSSANTRGNLYSNFPTREKIKFDTEHTFPRQAKIQQSYQTGIDKLRQNSIDLANQLKDINEAIADLNKI